MEVEEEEEDCVSRQDNFCFPNNSTNPETTKPLHAETIRQDPAPSTSRMIVPMSSRNFRISKMDKKRIVKKKISPRCPRVQQKLARGKAPMLVPSGGAEVVEVTSSVGQQASGSGDHSQGPVLPKTPLVLDSRCQRSAEKWSMAKRGRGKKQISFRVLRTRAKVLLPGGPEAAEVTSSVSQQASCSGDNSQEPVLPQKQFVSNVSMSAEKSEFYYEKYWLSLGGGRVSKATGRESKLTSADLDKICGELLNGTPEALKDIASMSDKTVAKLEKIHL